MNEVNKSHTNKEPLESKKKELSLICLFDPLIRNMQYLIRFGMCVTHIDSLLDCRIHCFWIFRSISDSWYESVFFILFFFFLLVLSLSVECPLPIIGFRKRICVNLWEQWSNIKLGAWCTNIWNSKSKRGLKCLHTHTHNTIFVKIAVNSKNTHFSLSDRHI